MIKREQERRKGSEDTSNVYQPGDLVLRKVEKMADKVNKLTPTFLGPYEVLQVHKADVQCKHLVTGAISVLHMSKLKPCFATREEAYEAAMVDYNQFQIEKILAYKGDPDLRTSMSFEVAFADGSVVWLPFSKDLFETVQFEEFVSKHRPLLPLKYTLEVWKRLQRESFRVVTEVTPGELCYVDLRAWGFAWFSSLSLPDGIYAVECKYIRWVNKSKRRIVLRCGLFNQTFTWDSFCVYAWGSNKELGDMVLVDRGFCQRYPKVLKGE